MKFKFILGLAFATMMTACTSTQKQAEENPVLTIEGGQIQGVLTDSTNVMVYKGIPYAAPPVGDLRWKRPQPVVAWEGVKQCDKWGYAPLQRDHVPGDFYTEEFYFGGRCQTACGHVGARWCLYGWLWS